MRKLLFTTLTSLCFCVFFIESSQQSEGGTLGWYPKGGVCCLLCFSQYKIRKYSNRFKFLEHWKLKLNQIWEILFSVSQMFKPSIEELSHSGIICLKKSSMDQFILTGHVGWHRSSRENLNLSSSSSAINPCVWHHHILTVVFYVVPRADRNNWYGVNSLGSTVWFFFF